MLPDRAPPQYDGFKACFGGEELKRAVATLSGALVNNTKVRRDAPTNAGKRYLDRNPQMTERFTHPAGAALISGLKHKLTIARHRNLHHTVPAGGAV